MIDHDEEVQLPTLDEFMDNYRRNGKISNSYVKEPGFSYLYVRMGLRILNDQRVSNVLELANAQAERPSSGTATRLLERLLTKKIPLYVENVFNPRLAKKLLRMGFIQDPSTHEISKSYFKLPERV